MAKPKKNWGELFSSKNKQTGGTQIGDFAEYPGGGTPLKKGEHYEKAETVEEAKQIRAENPDAKVRVMQPRDEEGHFTYNSANRRELEYGPSRGKTVPPFMKDWEISFSKKSGKGTFISDTGKKYIMPESIKSENDFINMFKQFQDDENGGKFGEFGESDTTKGKGGKTPKETITIKAGSLIEGFKGMASQAKNWGGLAYSKKKTVPTETASTSVPTPAPIAEDTNPFNAAAKDLDGFKKKYANEIKEVSDMIEDAGYTPSEILTDEFWTDLSDTEDTNSFDDLKKQLSDALR